MEERSTLGLAGVGTLTRFILRRDRIRLPVWILGITGLSLASAASLPGLYVDAAQRQARAELMESPVTAALSGPGYGLDDYTLGAMVANELLGFVAIVVALMSVFLVVRHTRAEEETGRTELVRATVVGRRSGVVAAVVVVSAANLAIGAIFAAVLPLIHEQFTVVGSIAFGTSVAAVGLVFVGVGVVVAQITEHARTASGYGVAAAGVAFSLRALGDATGATASASQGGTSALSWLSPIGWAQATRSYVDERWWPLLLAVALAAALTAIGLVLAARRDFGAGLVQPRPGPREASEGLVRPLGLALRMQRGMLLAWGAGLALIGLAYGTLLPEVEEFAGDFPTIEEWLARSGSGSLTESFVAVLGMLLALLAVAAGTQAALRLRSEETAGRAEPLLATGLSRSGWMGANLTVALLGSAFILIFGGVVMGVTAAVTMEDSEWLTKIPAATLVNVPAVWAVVALAAALFGAAPRLAGLTWAVVGYAAIVGMLGGLLSLPDWVADLSPFTHVPQVPSAPFEVVPIVLFGLATAVLLGVGYLGVQRRDIAST